MRLIQHLLNALIETGWFSEKTQVKMIGYMSGIEQHLNEVKNDRI